MGALHFYRTPHYCIIYAGVNNGRGTTIPRFTDF